MSGLLARFGLAPASALFRTFGSLLLTLTLAIGTAEAGTFKEAMWPITAAEMLRQQQAKRQPERDKVQPNSQTTRHAVRRHDSGVDAVPSCLPDQLKTALRRIEQTWGPVRIISAYRPNARVRANGRQSLHASCKAVDFRPPPGTFRAVAQWLRKNHVGGVGTYSGRFNHIHIDIRPCQPAKCYRWHN